MLLSVEYFLGDLDFYFWARLGEMLRLSRRSDLACFGIENLSPRVYLLVAGFQKGNTSIFPVECG